MGGNINVDTGFLSMSESGYLPSKQKATQTTTSHASTCMCREINRLGRDSMNWWEGRKSWGGIGLTVSCCHQGLELLSFGRGLGPGASSHGNLRSSSCPMVRRRKEQLLVYSGSSSSVYVFNSWPDSGLWCKSKAVDSGLSKNNKEDVLCTKRGARQTKAHFH